MPLPIVTIPVTASLPAAFSLDDKAIYNEARAASYARTLSRLVANASLIKGVVGFIVDGRQKAKSVGDWKVSRFHGVVVELSLGSVNRSLSLATSYNPFQKYTGSPAAQEKNKNKTLPSCHPCFQ